MLTLIFGMVVQIRPRQDMLMFRKDFSQCRFHGILKFPILQNLKRNLSFLENLWQKRYTIQEWYNLFYRLN